MKKQQNEIKKEITKNKELISILSSKPTIIFVNDLSKINSQLLERLREILPVIVLDKSKKNTAESKVRSSNAPCLFIADSNIYLNHEKERYTFGDINVIEGVDILGELETTLENKIEIPPKK